MNYAQGSIWRKWDLHIHSPGTTLNDQFRADGDDENVWDKYIDVLLKSDVSVFGITDYFSIDSYKKILEYIEKNAPLKNKTFFPNIELRLNIHVNKQAEEINLHILFDNKCEVSKIDEFLSKLSTVSSKDDGTTYKCTKTDLLELGYDKACVSIDGIKSALNEVFGRKKPYLIIGAVNGYGSNRPITNNTRKKLISDEVDKFCDLVFGTEKNTEYFLKTDRYDKGKAKRKAAITGSDCHSFSDCQKYLGKQYVNAEGIYERNVTWIKADTTFEGLKQLLIEPEGRVYIGVKPLFLDRVEKNSTKYIRKVTIRKIDGSTLSEKWFEKVEIELNPSLVSIIGNKGNGKSALADILSLVGNCKHTINFSFLRKNKFRDPQNNKASHFEASLEWVSGQTDGFKNLDEDPDKDKPAKVKYVPHNYFEILCNEDNKDEFEEELMRVIFSHVLPEHRLGAENLNELLRMKIEPIKRNIHTTISDISNINGTIIKLENASTENFKKGYIQQLELKKQELEVHKKNKPPLKNKPNDESVKQKTQDIEKINAEIVKYTTQIEEISKKKLFINKQIAEIEKVISEIGNVKDYLDSVKVDIVELLGSDYLKGFKFDYDKILSSKIELSSLTTSKDGLNQVLSEINDQLNPNSVESLISKRAVLIKQIDELKKGLSGPQLEYQQYLVNVKAWEDQQGKIIGSEDSQGSIKHLEKIIDYLNTKLGVNLTNSKKRRLDLSNKIFQKKLEMLAIYRELYKPVEDFIKQHKLNNPQYQAQFDVSLVLKNFESRFLNFIHRGTRGSFSGKEEGVEILKQIIEKTDLNSEAGIQLFLGEIMKKLQYDVNADNEERMISSQLREGVQEDFYNFLFSLEYIEPSYELKLGDKELSQLSPGEKGALLLIFYLLIDRNDIPLVLDQPEENLDNESIFHLLVPYIKEAKQNRQIIVVTHNPNLAVVSDAEQVIYAKLNKAKGNKLTYITGAIENPEVNNKIIDTLEGTIIAFGNRNDKYHLNLHTLP